MNFEGIQSRKICEIFAMADNLIHQMGLSSTLSISSGSDIASLKNSFNLSVCRASHTIKGIADFFQASELAIAQDSWRDQRLDEIEEHHRFIIKKLNQLAPSTLNAEQFFDHFVGQSVIQLARLTFPTFKLSKIFFAKLSKRGLTRERFPIHTEISSDQIDIIAESVDYVAGNLHRLKTFESLLIHGMEIETSSSEQLNHFQVPVASGTSVLYLFDS
jgi:hypothetical protein